MSPIAQNFDPMLAAAKGKGCSASIAFAAPERVVKVFMGGVGVASVSRSASMQPASLTELDRKPVASMEWLSNQMVGRDVELGEVLARFKVLPDGRNRSSALVLPKTDGALLPAQIVNSLYLDLSIPALHLALENRDALVLSSDSVAMSSDELLGDPRIRANPEGTPRYEQHLMDGGAPSRFLAAGTHKQVDPVQLFQKSDAFLPVARLEHSEVTVLSHYGLEVDLQDGEAQEGVWSARVRVSNLLHRTLKLRWFCDTLNRMSLSGRRTGRLRLPASGAATVTLKGTLRAELSALDGMDTVMFSVCNVARGLDDFVSGYIALRVS